MSRQSSVDRDTEAASVGPEDEPSRLLAASELLGTEIYNVDGSYVGDLEAVIIDRSTGWVAYAIVACGGWLGSGGRYHPLPWSILEYLPEQDAYAVAIERTTLEEAPSYSRTEIVDGTLSWAEMVRHYYSTPPFWF
jgi:hypothetical protein